MLDILANFVCDGGIEALLVRHLLFDVCPGHLVQLIYRGRDRADLVWRHSADLEDTVLGIVGIVVSASDTVEDVLAEAWCVLGVGPTDTVAECGVGDEPESAGKKRKDLKFKLYTYKCHS